MKKSFLIALLFLVLAAGRAVAVVKWDHSENTYTGAWPSIASVNDTVLHCKRLLYGYSIRSSHINGIGGWVKIIASNDSGKTTPDSIAGFRPHPGCWVQCGGLAVVKVHGITKILLCIAYYDTALAKFTDSVMTKPYYSSLSTPWTSPINMESKFLDTAFAGGARGQIRQLHDSSIVVISYNGVASIDTNRIFISRTWNCSTFTTHVVVAQYVNYNSSIGYDETSIEEDQSLYGHLVAFARSDPSDTVAAFESYDTGTTWAGPIHCFGEGLGNTAPPCVRYNPYDHLYHATQGFKEFTSPQILHGTWTDMGKFAYFDPVNFTSNRIYGDFMPLDVVTTYYIWCTNLMWSCNGYGAWRIEPLNKNNSVVLSIPNATRAYNFSLDTTKIAPGVNTIKLPLNRLADSTWWAQLPATNAVKMVYINDSVVIPHSESFYINKAKKKGSLWFTFNWYHGQVPKFSLLTGINLIDTNNSSMVFAPSNIITAFPMTDTSGTSYNDIAGGIVATGTTATCTDSGIHLTANGSNITSNANKMLGTVNSGLHQLMMSYNYLDSTVYAGLDEGMYFRTLDLPDYIVIEWYTDALWIERIVSGSSLNIRIPKALVPPAKRHNITWLFDASQDGAKLKNTIYADGVDITNLLSWDSVSTVRITVPGFVTTQSFGHTSSSAKAYYTDALFGNTVDQTNKSQIAKSIYYSEQKPESLFTNESYTSLGTVFKPTANTQISPFKNSSFKNPAFKNKVFKKSSFK